MSNQLEQDKEAIRDMFQSGGTADPETKRAKILNQVRGLLAQADSTTHPEEADTFRAKADQLMVEFAIEQWQIDKLQDGVNSRPKPEKRLVDFGWWSTSTRNSELWDMFHSVADHCRCVVAVRGYGDSGIYRQMPVIGIPSDLDYFDLLFTHLMLQMGKQLEPKPDPSLSFGENAYRLRAAGMARPRVAKLLYDMDKIPGVQTRGGGYVADEEMSVYPQGRKVDLKPGDKIPYEALAPNKEKSLRAKVRVAGEKWGKDQGYDPTTSVSPQVWQRSFAQGFVREISLRLWEMKKFQQDRPDPDNHMALALRDIRQMAIELYNELWPVPEVTYEEHGGSQRRRRVAMVREKKTSGRAMAAGRKAGREADLSAHPSKRVGSRKELE